MSHSDSRHRVSVNSRPLAIAQAILESCGFSSSAQPRDFRRVPTEGPRLERSHASCAQCADRQIGTLLRALDH